MAKKKATPGASGNPPKQKRNLAQDEAKARAEKYRKLAQQLRTQSEQRPSSARLQEEVNDLLKTRETLNTRLNELQDRLADVKREEAAEREAAEAMRKTVRERNVRFINPATGEVKIYRGQYDFKELPKDGIELGHFISQHTQGQLTGWLEPTDLHSEQERAQINFARKAAGEYAKVMKEAVRFLQNRPVAKSIADVRKLRGYKDQIHAHLLAIRNGGAEFYPLLDVEEELQFSGTDFVFA